MNLTELRRSRCTVLGETQKFLKHQVLPKIMNCFLSIHNTCITQAVKHEIHVFITNKSLVSFLYLHHGNSDQNIIEKILYSKQLYRDLLQKLNNVHKNLNFAIIYSTLITISLQNKETTFQTVFRALQVHPQ